MRNSSVGNRKPETINGRPGWEPAISTRICGTRDGKLGFEPETHLPLFVKHGFRTIELLGALDRGFVYMDPDSRRHVKAVADDLGVAIWSVHAPLSITLASPEPEEWGRQIDFLHRTGEAAAELGAEVVVCHIGQGIPPLGSTERGPTEGRIRESFEKLAGRVAGIPVAFCMETLTADETDLSHEQMLDLLDGLPAASFGFVIDTGHAFMAGDLYGLAQKAGPRLRSLHLHDCDGTRDQHLLPHDGGIDWKRFMCDLMAADYAGPLLFEALRGGVMNFMLERCERSYQRLLREAE